ncbi:hypothetical protein OVY01_06895 [Robbsia sp. Bb-Pol-6]|uniref:Uncharacterized protein n=1 Tax=Robbsia betulipollinis TaxID=2981849 RepID=A0ABT3ZKA8_9BURK|nr:hypothetical protein [Robbsia betulipollinis]MCY0386963.1 hypothetical protein [Robbsia betulipollinis]
MLAINKIVEHTRVRFYGNRSIDPTGPGLLGWACAKTLAMQWERREKLNQYIGISTSSRNADGLKLDFHVRAEKLSEENKFASRLRRASDASYMGASGANTYVEAWHQRDVYR